MSAAMQQRFLNSTCGTLSSLRTEKFNNTQVFYPLKPMLYTVKLLICTMTTHLLHMVGFFIINPWSSTRLILNHYRFTLCIWLFLLDSVHCTHYFKVCFKVKVSFIFLAAGEASTPGAKSKISHQGT